ncbi:MAG TPA: hypothetical protein PK014_11845 [Thermoanaerobaculia bacterium]|nr:hypothetical protein [Thermoanaerobaculia bacterium]HUM28826.1 hypothetical protein [Thermoanaerobaculia bacterium]HXK69083.1 hypothetical protein [Thermoanaerobaculia bacterium]
MITLFALLAFSISPMTAPTPLLEYQKANEIASERITLFSDGILVLLQKGPGEQESQLQRQLSPEEQKVYLQVLNEIAWNELNQKMGQVHGGDLTERFSIRYQQGSANWTVTGTMMDTFPLPMNRLFALIDDLRDLLMTRTTDVHPLISRPPVPGDRLVDYLGRTFVLRSIRPEDGVYVLQGEKEPFTLEVTLEQLPSVMKDYADSGRDASR